MEEASEIIFSYNVAQLVGKSLELCHRGWEKKVEGRHALKLRAQSAHSTLSTHFRSLPWLGLGLGASEWGAEAASWGEEASARPSCCPAAVYSLRTRSGRQTPAVVVASAAVKEVLLQLIQGISGIVKLLCSKSLSNWILCSPPSPR
jgi:hypothetical protein